MDLYRHLYVLVFLLRDCWLVLLFSWNILGLLTVFEVAL
jgi:hypothetical protein